MPAANAKLPIRIGILGAAAIARSFCTAVAPSQKVRVTAVASRDGAKGAAFARELGIGRTLPSYDALLADPDIDAIYNPLPNALHAEWAIKAANARKHVLCEKPLALTAAEARAMFDAAHRNGVVLVEAYPYRAQPQTLRVAELIRDGAIGRIRLIRATFGVPFSDPANIRLMPALGGGALLDAGSYAVSFVRLVARERPTRVNALARYGATGVDMTLVATLDYASGLAAQISCSFETSYHRNAQIIGETGSIETRYLNHPPLGGPAIVSLRKGATVNAVDEIIEVAPGNGFLAEAESFARMLAEGPEHWTGASEAESVDIIATLEALAKSARSGSWEPVSG